MTGVRAVGRLPWVAIGAGLILAGCGSTAAPTAQLSHAASRRDRPKGSAPNVAAVQPNGAQRCTEVYCLTQAVPRGRANGAAPNATAVQPNSAERCAEVYCLPQTVPRRPVSLTTRG
jgi:hypothetical protein